MMNLDQMDMLLKQSLKPKRYLHSINTMKVAVKLADHYGENRDLAEVAGLLHDCAKELSDEETKSYCIQNGIVLSAVEEKQIFLMHGVVGAVLAREKYCVDHPAILNAIRYHTTGFAGMSMLDKIIFLADYIEPGRTHHEVDRVRKLAFTDINSALHMAFDNIIRYVISQNGLIHPFTIEARNSILEPV